MLPPPYLRDGHGESTVSWGERSWAGKTIFVCFDVGGRKESLMLLRVSTMFAFGHCSFQSPFDSVIRHCGAVTVCQGEGSGRWGGIVEELRCR